jgi:hypothetical protein
VNDLVALARSAWQLSVALCRQLSSVLLTPAAARLTTARAHSLLLALRTPPQKRSAVQAGCAPREDKQVFEVGGRLWVWAATQGQGEQPRSL